MVIEQTQEISDLQKQISAYENDDSEEAKAKVQELRVSLENAQDELSETEYDKFISDSEILLDSLYLEYENILNARLDNVDALLDQVITGVNATTNALGAEGTIATALGADGAIAQAIVGAVSENGSIQSILNKEASSVGTTLSGTMNTIWSVGDGNAKSVLTKYGEGFQNKQTTTNDALNKIKADIAAMVDDVDKEAQNKVVANKTVTSAEKKPVNTTAITTDKKDVDTVINKNVPIGDGKPKVGDKVKFVSGKYYYDSQGKTPLGSKYQGKEVYITKINDKSWATHPYHISTGNKLGLRSSQE